MRCDGHSARVESVTGWNLGVVRNVDRAARRSGHFRIGSENVCNVERRAIRMKVKHRSFRRGCVERVRPAHADGVVVVDSKVDVECIQAIVSGGHRWGRRL